MTFEQRLVKTAQQIAARLECVCHQLAAQGVPNRLNDALTHALLSGGKRLRPLLVLECAKVFGVDERHALETACAIECVHCYSLVHDDLPAMDNDRLRRGKPTVWTAYDEWSAILAGDALQSLAFELLAHENTHPDPAVRAQLVSGLARAAGAQGMAGGQALDLAADKRSEPLNPDAAHIKKLHAMKTGALIKFSCEAAAILAQDRVTQNERDAICTFGANLGFAFQVADDLLDVEGDVATVGKAVAKDTRAGKATLVSIVGVEATRASLADAVQKALDALAPFGERANTLRDAAKFVSERKR